MRTFLVLAGKHPKVAEKQTHRYIPRQLAKFSPLPLDRASANKGKGQRRRKSLLYSRCFTRVITVTAVKSHLLEA